MMDNSIIITTRNNKNKLIKKNSNEGMYNIIYLTKEEFYQRYFFTYNKETIYYIMNNYNIDYNLALEYLNNLYFIDTSRKYDSKKIEQLKDLKIKLDNNNLLIYDKLFHKLIKDKKIYISNIDYLPKEEEAIFTNIGNITYLNDKKNNYDHNEVYKCQSIEDECTFVATKICQLLNDNVDINNIKVMGINEEYNNIISRIFSLFNLKISIYPKKSIYETKEGKLFLKTLSIEDITNNDIYNKVVNILNKYVGLDYKKYLSLIEYDFKHTYLDINKYSNTIEIISYKDYIPNDDEYVFLMNFNEGAIPRIYIDDEYLSNKEKDILNMSTTFDLNKEEEKSVINLIKSIKNLIISYKEKSYNGDYYPSSLVSLLNLKVVEDTKNYKYSNIYNKIKLTSYLDNYIKYNSKHPDLDILFNIYPEINYLSYDNKFSGINALEYQKYLNDKKTLSYSSMDNFYKCSFKYYIANILKLSIYEDTFMTYLGSLFHYILSICFEENFDYEKEYNNYLDNNKRDFSYKEKYYLNKLKEELILIITILKKQKELNTLDKYLYENKIDIEIGDGYIFTGIIDKLITKEINNNTLVAIIDYKTGTPNINLNNIIYGLDMQLAVYLYLCYNYDKIKNPQVVGFYLQKILNGPFNKDKKISYDMQREKKLKLEGYSTNNLERLALFDASYEDSKVIKSMKTTSNGISSYAKIIDDEAILKIVEITNNKIIEAKEEIMNARFNINPKSIENNNVGCKFCKFNDICFKKNEDIVNLKEYKKTFLT